LPDAVEGRRPRCPDPKTRPSRILEAQMIQAPNETEDWFLACRYEVSQAWKWPLKGRVSWYLGQGALRYRIAITG
jgi:hypothetical protein